MLVTGYKANANFLEAQLVIKKHTKYSTSDAKQICEAIKEGKAVKLPDDFVLREDLEELSFTVE